MRALFLLDGLAMGGSERKSVRLVNDLAARGSRVYLAYLEDVAVLLPQIDRRVPTACLHRTGKFSLRALRNLRAFVRAHDVAVILCMNLYPLLYAVALKLLGRPSLKIVLAVNITDFERPRDRWFMLLYSPLMRLTRTVVYGCEYQRELWAKRYALGAVPSRVIYNGVDTEHFDPARVPRKLREDLGLADSFVIGCVARLHPEKNLAGLLEVAARLGRDSPVDVILVGTGPERERLGRLAAQLGIAQRVHFLGRMNDVRPALAAIDVFVLPSVAVETFSNSALEAMAMALPVVLSRIAGAPEMVTDAQNGFLYESHDMERLGALLRELRSDAALRRRLGASARDTVLTRFNFARMIADYEALVAGV